MIEAHTIDAWTRTSDKQTVFYGYLSILGGFAAPLFLWLAGLGVVLSATRAAERTGNRTAAVEAAVRRGLEIFILAFLFRLQAFIVSPGSHPVTIFRVDVLNIMGPAMVAAGLLWAISSRAIGRVTIFAAVTALIALATPIVRATPLVDDLPTWLQWYLRPAGEHTTFTLLPWAGFVFAGAASGAVLSAARGSGIERRALRLIGATGALLVAAGFVAATRPSIYTVPSSFWTSSPTWFAIRVGVLMLTLTALSTVPVATETTGARWRDRVVGALVRWWQVPLSTLGRASLFVYWIHVELVYGYTSWFWRRRLPVWVSLVAYASFAALMYGMVVARDRYLARRTVTIPEATALSQA
jgi:uncharacterized membrane protein